MGRKSKKGKITHYDKFCSPTGVPFRFADAPESVGARDFAQSAGVLRPTVRQKNAKKGTVCLIQRNQITYCFSELFAEMEY